MRHFLYSIVAGTALACGVASCSTAPKSEGERAVLASDASAAIARFKSTDPTLQKLLDASVGWAVFPDVNKAGLGIGGAYGRGEVFEKGRKIGYCDITAGSIGLQIGAQSFSELIVFLQQEDLSAFKQGNFEFAANASAVALASGAAAAADYSKGVIVFTETRGGLMAEASIGGQKFTFQPL